VEIDHRQQILDRELPGRTDKVLPEHLKRHDTGPGDPVLGQQVERFLLLGRASAESV
jgi:hypothetical protein